jgi:polyhydroxyalkanoate synthesis repressor PhaR
MRIIKKYSNRRLYDTQTSTYVNLDQIAALIRDGDEIQVVDSSSGGDLTRAVLFQVLMEQRSRVSVFPVGLLHRIIRFGGDSPAHGALNEQLTVGMQTLDAQLSRLERRPGSMNRGAPPLGADAPAEIAAGGLPIGELDALRQRLADLETRLKG